jgi:hypothetical protein
MMEERRLRVSANRELRRIFGPKRDEVARKWRKLRNEELYDLYCSPNIVRVINEMGGACSTYGEGRNAYRGLVGRPQGKDHLEDLGVNGMDLQEAGRDDVDWIDLDQNRDRWRTVVSEAMNL